MSSIIKNYQGSIEVDIREFNNDQLLESLNERTLTKEQQSILFEIADSYKPKEIFYSDYPPDFDSFIQKAISEKKIAVIDRDVVIEKQIIVDGDLTVRALDDIKIEIASNVVNGFILKTGEHIFRNIKTTHLNPEGNHYFTDQTFNILWNNHFEDVQMIGGRIGYNSSRGGTENHMNFTFIKNAKFDNSYHNIAVFSQDGPYKALHLENVQLKTTTSHNIYVHPSVSLHYINVTTLGAGKLMQHQYSGSGNGGYETGKYSYFEKVNTGTTAFEMTSLANNQKVIIKDSTIAPYVTGGVKPALVYATNSHFTNQGNGIFLRGTLENCSGGFWTSSENTLEIIGGKYTDSSFRGGGTLVATNMQLANFWGADRGNNFEITFNNCAIGTIYEGGLGFGIINLNNSTVSRYTPANFRTELINIIN